MVLNQLNGLFIYRNARRCLWHSVSIIQFQSNWEMWVMIEGRYDDVPVGYFDINFTVKEAMWEDLLVWYTFPIVTFESPLSRNCVLFFKLESWNLISLAPNVLFFQNSILFQRQHDKLLGVNTKSELGVSKYYANNPIIS